MPIAKGEDWGTVGPLPSAAPIAASDAEIAELYATHGSGLIVGVTGGDLARTVGARTSTTQLRSGDRTLLPVDMGIAHLPGGDRPFAAHLIRRRRLWAGPTVAVMNAAFRSTWNVAPRGHPNDGRLDLIEAELSLGDRWKARSRLPSGSHIPHPDISIRRLKSGRFDVESGAVLLLDGVPVAATGEVRWSVVPDALTIAI